MQKFFLLICLFLSVVYANDFTKNRQEEKSIHRSGIAIIPSLLEEPVDSNYVLGPGDYLDLYLEQNSFSLQIYPDGSIAIDQCGVVNVGGKTLPEARKLILEVTSSQYDPEKTFVRLSRLKNYKVTAMGALNKVGQFSVDPETRLSTFIRMVEGFRPSADQEKMILVRKGDTLKVNYEAMVRKGEIESDYKLEPGDFIFVPYVDATASVALVTPTAQYSLPYKEGRTISEYHSLGVGDNIETGGYLTILVKTPKGEEKRYSVLESSTKTVDPGSEIMCMSIKEEYNNSYVYVGGAVAAMGKVPYNPEYKALDYIAASGVMPITGTWNQVTVVRGNRETIRVNATEDEIFPGDYIEIPKSRYEKFKDITMFLASLLTVISSSFIIYMNYK